MERHSIGAPCSATPANSATTNNDHNHIYSGTSRRALLAGMAALPLAACPAPVPAAGAVPAGVGPALSALIATADAAMADFNSHRTGFYDPAEEREARARLAGDTPEPIPSDVTQRDTDLLAAVTSAEWEVANHPVTTPADFHAKVSFMAERQMFEGINHAGLMLADAARLAGMEA